MIYVAIARTGRESICGMIHYGRLLFQGAGGGASAGTGGRAGPRIRAGRRTVQMMLREAGRRAVIEACGARALDKHRTALVASCRFRTE